MKILYMCDTFFPVVGGMSVVADKMATCLSKYADVTMVAVKKRGYTDPQKPYKILRCRGFYSRITKDGFAFPSFDKKFREEIISGGYDIIHIHSAGNLMTYAYKLRKKLNIPVVSTIHCEYYLCTKGIVKIGWLAKIITKGLLKKNYKADQVWTVCEYNDKRNREFLPCSAPMTVMRNCTELADNEDVAAKAKEIKAEYGIDNNTFVMTYVARMVKLKNVDLIIDSINSIKDKIENVKIFLVGGGDYLEHLQNRVAELGLDKFFVFTGMINDRDKIAAFYKIASLALFPSVCEAAGGVQLEAAALKCPTLVIRELGPAEQIVDGENGYLSDPTVEDFSQKILEAIENRNALAEMGEKAYQTIYQCYDEKYAKKVLALYKQYIDEFNQKHKNQ